MTDSETVTAEEIDRMVDEGQDMTAYIKMDTLQTPNIEKDVSGKHTASYLYKLSREPSIKQGVFDPTFSDRRSESSQIDKA